jgi:hypothetical protein
MTVQRLSEILAAEAAEGHGDHLVTFGPDKRNWCYIGSQIGYSGISAGYVLELEPESACSDPWTKSAWRFEPLPLPQLLLVFESRVELLDFLKSDAYTAWMPWEDKLTYFGIPADFFGDES